MTLAQLEQRVRALEDAVKQLQEQIARGAAANQQWWRENAGRFANDPLFDEMVRLSQEYRESLDADQKKKRQKPVRSTAKSRR